MGYVRWRIQANPVTSKAMYGVIDMLAVTSRARRQGIGKRLIGYCIQVRCVACLCHDVCCVLWALLALRP